MIKNKINSIITCFALLAVVTVQAQQFKYRAKLDSVKSTGFYSINVTPELSGHVKTDFRDLRIVDDKQQQIPYVIKSVISSDKSQLHYKLKIVNQINTDSGNTVLIVENDKIEKINSIELKIQNNSVSRTANFSGSNNQKNWFIIKEKILLESNLVGNKDDYFQNLDFPVSGYKYYKLVIFNQKNDPLNITEVYTKPILLEAAGSYNFQYIQNPETSFRIIDSNHITRIIGRNYNLYHINKINLLVKGPKFFKRDVKVMFKDNTYSTEISSDHLFSFDIPAFNDKYWMIKIYNNDNPPLKIIDVETAQISQQIIAYLEAGKKYELQLSSDSAKKPNYDLQNFEDKIPDATVLNFSPIEPIPVSSAAVNEPVISKTTLWIIIIAIIIILTIFTIKLAKNVSKQ